MMTIVGSRSEKVLSLTRGQWSSLLSELAKRGRGSRESGAFLLADKTGGRKARAIVYLDDLDPNCLTGGITFKGTAYSRLWDICSAKHMTVIADVHTHPGRAVAQSDIDQDNPMISQVGHVAIIIPSYARGKIKTRDIGVHIYRGDAGWDSWFRKDAARLVELTWW